MSTKLMMIMLTIKITYTGKYNEAMKTLINTRKKMSYLPLSLWYYHFSGHRWLYILYFGTQILTLCVHTLKLQSSVHVSGNKWKGMDNIFYFIMNIDMSFTL